MAITSNRKLMAGAAGGLAAALIAGGVLFGTALARPGGPAPGPPDGQDRRAELDQRHAAFVDRLAANLGVSEQKLRDALVKTKLELVDDAVKAGRLTREQGERIKQHIQQGGPGFGPHGGHHGPHGRGDVPRGGPWGASFSAVEQALDLNLQELHARLREGKSVAEIARGQGKDPDDVERKIVANLKSRIDDAADSGRLPRERADEWKSRVEQFVDRMMDHKPGQGFGPDRRPGSPHRGGP